MNRSNSFLIKLDEGVINFNPNSFSIEFTSGSKHWKGTLNGENRFWPKFDSNLWKPEICQYRIEVTANCNGACPYCIVSTNKIKDFHSSMTEQEAMRIVEEYNNQVGSGGHIIILGGEPLINWNVVRLIINAVHSPVIIFTNGTLLKKYMLKDLCKKHVFIYVSHDSISEKHCLRMFKNGEKMHNSAIDAINLLKNAGGQVGISSFIDRRNTPYLLDLVKWMNRSLGIKYFAFGWPHYSGSISFEFDEDAYSEALWEVFLYSLKSGIFIFPIYQRIAPMLFGKPRIMGCNASGQQVDFFPDGRRSTCIKLEDFGQEADIDILIGNLPINNSYCQGCEAILLCGGGCPLDGKMLFNRGVDERECRINRYFLKKLLIHLYYIWLAGDIINFLKHLKAIYTYEAFQSSEKHD